MIKTVATALHSTVRIVLSTESVFSRTSRNGGRLVIKKYFIGGAWWYKSCMHVHLTGKYLNGTVPSSKKYKGVYWETFRGPLYSLKKVRMMVKPRDDTSLPFLLH
jgi:hypothetical protein